MFYAFRMASTQLLWEPNQCVSRKTRSQSKSTSTLSELVCHLVTLTKLMIKRLRSAILFVAGLESANGECRDTRQATPSWLYGEGNWRTHLQGSKSNTKISHIHDDLFFLSEIYNSQGQAAHCLRTGIWQRLHDKAFEILQNLKMRAPLYRY